MPRLYSDESIISPFTIQIWIPCMVPKVSAVPKQRSGCANAPGARYYRLCLPVSIATQQKARQKGGMRDSQQHRSQPYSEPVTANRFEALKPT